MGKERFSEYDREEVGSTQTSTDARPPKEHLFSPEEISLLKILSPGRISMLSDCIEIKISLADLGYIKQVRNTLGANCYYAKSTLLELFLIQFTLYLCFQASFISFLLFVTRNGASAVH